ncbi:hypothetical protein ACFLWY_00420 [Chloroflexota bacterium]
MKIKSKRVLVSISLITIIALLASGCGQSQPEKTSAPGYTPPRIHINKAPRLGEEAEITFTLDVPHGLKPITKVWIEFERYDPTLRYPLGRGDGKDDTLRMMSERFSPTNPEHILLMEAAEAQPGTLVPSEEVLVNGDLDWQGEPLREGDQVRLQDTVRFTEEGEWLVIGRWWVEGQATPAYAWDYLELTVSKHSGMFGWPKDYSHSSGQAPGEFQPIGVLLKPSQAPLVGEPFELRVWIYPVRDIADGEVFLQALNRTGTPWKAPIEDILVEGDLHWKGKLEENVSVELSGTIAFPEEGNWEISAWVKETPQSYPASHMSSIFLHVGKERSQYGWPEDPYKKLKSPSCIPP